MEEDILEKEYSITNMKLKREEPLQLLKKSWDSIKLEIRCFQNDLTRRKISTGLKY
jgi:hypothetical protein